MSRYAARAGNSRACWAGNGWGFGAGAARDGRPYTSIFTIGYDPPRARFVATWIDSVQTHIGPYTSTLDDSSMALPLNTWGPILGDPATTAQYRETVEILAAVHKVIRSMILGLDGDWFEFSRAEYRRSR
jgi:hypothetical protein